MSTPILFEDTFNLPQPRRAIWAILSQTDWINRALGLPAVQYQFQPRTEGGTEVMARARTYGLSFRWRELPFEWVEPDYYQVRRVFESGPLVALQAGVRLADAGAGCAVTISAQLEPRNFLGQTLARQFIGPSSLRGLRRIAEEVSAQLTAQQRVVLPGLPITAPNRSALQQGIANLTGQNQPVHLVERLTAMLEQSPDVELTHVRPFTVARQWGQDRWEVLRLFLHATRAGLLNLSWEVLCPNCRSSRADPKTTLESLGRAAHCDVCNIRFDAEFDKSVELKFSIHPSIRDLEKQTFCLAGPGGKPHVLGQIYLSPNVTREWCLPEYNRPLRLRSPQVTNILAIPAGQFLPSGQEVVCHTNHFEVRAKTVSPSSAPVTVINPNPFPVQLILEESEWDEEILTAARVTNWQEFRDLFSREVISPTEQVSVGFQVVLFTDLRGSTALYTSIGDAPAYVLVRDHFSVLREAVNAHHGVVIKTIGDAIMAGFSQLPEAIGAARRMHTELRRLKPGDATLQLKSALHAGHCLAVNANDRLDYFGTTVNLAARLVEISRGNDLVIADNLYQRLDVQESLRDLSGSPVPDEEQLTGFSDSIKVWRVPM